MKDSEFKTFCDWATANVDHSTTTIGREILRDYVAQVIATQIADMTPGYIATLIINAEFNYDLSSDSLIMEELDSLLEDIYIEELKDEIIQFYKED